MPENSLSTSSQEINLSDNLIQSDFQNAEKTEPLNLPITNNPLQSNQLIPIKPKKVYKYLRKTGRHSIYSPFIAQNICRKIANGQSLKSICKEKGMPSLDTIYSWIRTNKEFLDLYEKAKDDQIDGFAEEIVDISDGKDQDYIEKVNDQGQIIRIYDTEHVQRSRLRVDSRKWVAERMKPRKYGVSPAPSVNVAVQVNNNITIELDDRINQLLKDRENKLND